LIQNKLTTELLEIVLPPNILGYPEIGGPRLKPFNLMVNPRMVVYNDIHMCYCPCISSTLKYFQSSMALQPTLKL